MSWDYPTIDPPDYLVQLAPELYQREQERVWARFEEAVRLAEHASHVEPGQDGRWRADLTPVGGPVLGPFDRRSAALEAERRWLERHWLIDPDGTTRL